MSIIGTVSVDNRYVLKIGSLRYPVFGQNIHVATGGVAWVQESVMSRTRMLYKPVLLFFHQSACIHVYAFLGSVESCWTA